MEENNIIKNAEQYAHIKNIGKKHVKGGNDIIVNHVDAANILIRFIELTPMDEWCKKVMIMRIGNPLINCKPMTHIQIALALGCMEDEVREIEEAGKNIVNDYMKKVTQPEFIEKFERDRRLKAHVDDTFNKIVNSDKNPTA